VQQRVRDDWLIMDPRVKLEDDGEYTNSAGAGSARRHQIYQLQNQL
jgi:hypothetical protein